MAKYVDLLIDPTTGDLQLETARNKLGIIEQGVVLGNVTWQNQAIILQMAKGELKEYAMMGASIADIVFDNELLGWKREIMLQMESDGMKVQEVDIDIINNKLTIDAEYS